MSSQLEDAFNEAVERRVRMLRAAELVESWSCCGQTFTGSSDFISGVRAVHTCPPEDVPDAETAYAMGKADAASPDERLREALAWIAEYGERNGDLRTGHLQAVKHIARNALGLEPGLPLAAADREAHLEPAPQNDETRAQIVAARLIADREAPAPDERLREANGYEQRIAALDDLVQRAWSLIAAAMSGSPRQFSDEWKDSAERWEVDYCMGQGASGLRSRSSVGGGGVVSAVDADAPHQREPGEAPDTPGTCRAPHCWSEYGTPCANCPEEKR